MEYAQTENAVRGSMFDTLLNDLFTNIDDLIHQIHRLDNFSERIERSGAQGIEKNAPEPVADMETLKGRILEANRRISAVAARASAIMGHLEELV